jgi:hypothetical protein
LNRYSGKSSFHSIKRFLEKLQVRSVACLFARAFNPFLLQSIFRRSVILIKHPKYSRKRELREFVGGELVGDVVAQLVLWRVVPSLLLDHFEAAALARVARIEYARIKLDAFREAFDDGEALVIHGALDHLDHVIDLRGVRPRNERGPGADQFLHRIDRLVDRAGRVGLRFETDG